MDDNKSLYTRPGPMLILAGPGTGKTFLLAKRIKHLVEVQEVDPENITMITFTANAARNMHERISNIDDEDLYIPPEKHPRRITTMNSLGYEIVREKASDFGLKENIRVVYSNSLRDILVSDAAQIAGFNRDDGLETAKCRQFADCRPEDDKKCIICEKYQQILRCNSAIDYDDQILLACTILKKYLSVLEKFQSFCKHLLIDEYQDINTGQFVMIDKLSEEHRDGLFAVGDDDQSIYSWRGGSPEFIRSFEKCFGGNAKTKTLQVSFRCHPNILEGALSVVSEFDLGRLPKGKFDYKKKEGKKIQVHNVPSHEKEARILRRIVRSSLPSRSVLILMPGKRFSEAITDELRKEKVNVFPLTPPGEGLPLISTLRRWLMNNADSISFRECLEAYTNNPDSGIPSKRSKKSRKLEKRDSALLKISSLWKLVLEGEANSIWEAIILNKEKESLYLKIFDAFNQLLSFYDDQDDPSDFIAETIKTLAPWKKAKALLEEIDMWVEASKYSEGTLYESGVQLTTLQGAKGLEARVVCIVGLEDGIMPRGDTPEELEEQSRLMYVSMTRASEELHLFHARKRPGHIIYRDIYRKGEPPDIRKSRFIDVIPLEHKENRYHKA